MKEVVFQTPCAAHAAEISEMVRRSPELDHNSEYLYALWCTYFSESSAVALRKGEVIAFVTGFRCPSSPDTYFLWQAAAKRRHGVPNLGLNLIHHAAKRQIDLGARVIQASVDWSNKPITFLMRMLCKRLGGTMKTSVLFTSESLSTATKKHHDEILFRIELPPPGVEQAVASGGEAWSPVAGG